MYIMKIDGIPDLPTFMAMLGNIIQFFQLYIFFYCSVMFVVFSSFFFGREEREREGEELQLHISI